MKKTTIFAFVYIIFTILSLAVPQVSFTASYEPGTLLRDPEDKTIYYIAENGKRYAFPNEATLRTWYPETDASIQTAETKRTLTRIRSGKAQITARPGNTLVMFGADPKVYAVDTAAVLRWVKTEKAAVRLFGLNWQTKIVRLPAGDSWNYTIGRTLDEADSFPRTTIAQRAFSVEEELKARKLIIEKKKTPLQPVVVARAASANTASLASLRENLKGRLVPRFSSARTSYQIDAKHNEAEMLLTPRAFHPEATVTINGAPLARKTSARLALNYGDNRFMIAVQTPDDQTMTYSVIVRRRNPSTDAYLIDINENVSGSLSPAFDPDEYEYDLTARNTEESVRFSVERSDSTSVVTINGVTAQKGRSVTVPLPIGITEVPMTVRAENGTTRTYTVRVNRTQFAQTEDRDLASLKENLAADFSPEFDPNYTRYYLRATADENRVLITATPKNKYARVFINGDPVRKKSIVLHDDENEIIVRVEANDTYFTEYKIIVEKDFE